MEEQNSQKCISLEKADDLPQFQCDENTFSSVLSWFFTVVKSKWCIRQKKEEWKKPWSRMDSSNSLANHKWIQFSIKANVRLSLLFFRNRKTCSNAQQFRIPISWVKFKIELNEMPSEMASTAGILTDKKSKSENEIHCDWLHWKIRKRCIWAGHLFTLWHILWTISFWF